jgi:hypothetical protein
MNFMILWASLIKGSPIRGFLVGYVYRDPSRDRFVGGAVGQEQVSNDSLRQDMISHALESPPYNQIGRFANYR